MTPLKATEPAITSVVVHVYLCVRCGRSYYDKAGTQPTRYAVGNTHVYLVRACQACRQTAKPNKE